MKTNPKRESNIIELYFGVDMDSPKTLKEIGDKLNLMRERICQLKEKAIKRFQYSTRAPLLKAFLG